MVEVDDVKSRAALLLSELEDALGSDEVTGADLATIASSLSGIVSEMEVLVGNG